MKKVKYLIIILVLLPIVAYVFWPVQHKQIANSNNSQSPEQVFQVSAKLVDKNKAKLAFVIAPDYYIYKNRLQISFLPNKQSIALNSIIWPHSLLIPDINDPDKTDEVLTGKFTVDIPIKAGTSQLNLTLQGCDGKSICYPPQKYTFNLTESKNVTNNGFIHDFMGLYHGDISNRLSNLNTFELIILFFIAGIAIALTPCMYPLYPIALSTIIGNSVSLKRSNILALVISYIHGIAIIYVIMGFLAAYTGQLFTTIIQTPIVVVFSGLIWFILGLSMFDLFEIKLPNSLNSYLHTKSMSINGGSYTKVFIMGIFSSILLGPCVTPPLIAAIGFIVGRADVIFGGLALYAISLGMGVPILILALVGDKILPRSGRWMTGIKYFMGSIMIAGSIYLVVPFLYNHYFTKAVITTSQGSYGETVVTTSSELNSAIRQSKKPVIIDFYASWCTICKEMEKTTFADKNVQQALSQYTVIKFDLSQNTPDELQVLKRYGLYGPPALLILSKDKSEDKILGFVAADDLIHKLKLN
jgi:thiol:disulfide interchange protein DsbD